MKAARESLEENVVNDVDLTIEDSEAEAALADDTLGEEIATDVVEPLNELEAGLDDVDAIDADADRIEASADVLEETLADDGPGVDPIAAQLVGDDVAAAVERWTGRKAKPLPSRESFNQSAGRRDATKQYVAVAREAVEDFRKRATEAVKKAWEWLKEILTNAVDKAARLESRAKALGSAASKLGQVGGGGQEIKVAGLGALGGKSPVEASAALASLEAEVDKAYTIGTWAKSGELVLNDAGVGGARVVMTPGQNGKVQIDIQQVEGQDGGNEMKALSAAEQGTVCANVIKACQGVRAARKGWDAAYREAMKGATTDTKEGKDANKLARADHSIQTRAVSALVKCMVNGGNKLLDIVDRSAKAIQGESKQAEKEASAAAKAAAKAA